jgi:methanethiol oxidase
MRALRRAALLWAVTSSLAILVPAVRADETCLSPYTPKIIGAEDYVYVWTLGIDGVGDGSDKLVTVGAHHGDFSDDRRYFWVGGLDDSMIYVFDVASDPAKPKLTKTIKDFATKSGVVGPHTFNALPGRMLITGLSNEKDKGGKTGIVEYNNNGEYIAMVWMPDAAEYGYDARIQPRLNRMLTSSFTGWNNYMRPLGDLMKDSEAMKHFGNTMVVWDAHARKPLQILEVPGAPLEIRWALQPKHDYAFTATALTSKIWLIERKDDGTFAATAVSDVGDPKKIPLPVDISLSVDDKYLFVSTFMDGTARVYDVSNPHKPKLVTEQKVGSQVNMVSETWGGERVYFTSSLLANWDKGGKDDEQFLKAYKWDGKTLGPLWSIDFKAEKLGRPHIMRFGQESFYKNEISENEAPAEAVSENVATR